MKTRTSSSDPAARLYTILSLWQVAAVSFGYLCMRFWLRNSDSRTLRYYLHEDPFLTRLVLFVKAVGPWALILPLAYWVFVATRKGRPPSFLGAILLAAGLTFVYALATYQAFRMAFASVSM